MKPDKQTIEYIVLAVAAVIILVLLLMFGLSRKFKASYEKRWKDNQRLLSHKATWTDAIVGADKLLDEVLKKRRFKGKTMGERLVAAQHHLTSNDMVWFSHKLRNKIVYEGLELTKTEVKQAMLGFWQALRDLDAFNRDKDKHDKK